jgi:hypothetical protein
VIKSDKSQPGPEVMNINQPAPDQKKYRQSLKMIFNRENLLALLLALALIAIYLATASDSPTWIYQGF